MKAGRAAPAGRSARLSAAALAAVLSYGCTGSAVDVELVLSGSCAAGEMAAITVLSVDVYGVDGEGRLCSLSKRCLFEPGPLASVEDVTVALRAAQQPLIDVAAPESGWVVIAGHTRSCWQYDDQALCGFADLADAGEGRLEVAMRCGGCPTDQILFCP